MPAAHRSATRPRTPPPRSRWTGRLLPWLLLVAGLAGLATPAAADEGEAAVFARWEAAWTGRNAGGVVSLTAREGRLDLSLLSPGVRGRFQRAQAQRTLAGYFEKVALVHLKDVTPRDPDDPPRPGFRARLYDYSYQPRGYDAVVTRLVITLKTAGEEGWVLDSISETPRPPPEDGE